MIAVIDIGTVTARLAVAEVAGGRVLRMAKHSEICNKNRIQQIFY